MITTGDTSAQLQDHAHLNFFYIWTISLIAALGGLLFGYDWVVIGGAAKFYEAFFQLRDTASQISVGAGAFEKIRASMISPVGWAQSCALLGCLIGAMASGALSDRFGRKPLLILSAANFVLSSIGIAATGSFKAFVAWRILGGVSIGLASTISPMYISEIAPAKVRGLLVAINQLTIVIGVLAAQLINWLIARPVPTGMSTADFAQSWNVQSGWRWMFAACAVPSLLFFFSSIFVPESPRWLAKAGRRDAAGQVLRRIGGEAYSAVALKDVESSLIGQTHRVRLSEFLDRGILRVLAIGIFLAVFQQCCGINVIFNYAGEIFRQAGYDLNDTLTNIVWTGAVNFAFTIVALLTVDRLGRKPLMLIGSTALAGIYIALGYCYHVRSIGGQVPNVLFLVLVLAAIGAYATSLAPVTWVIISEIFPNRIRGTAISLAVAFLWIACFVLTYTFPILNAQLGAAITFWIYAGVCLIGLIFILVRLSETTGKTLEQIQAELTN